LWAKFGAIFVWRKVVLKELFIVWFLTPSMWHPSHAPTPIGNLLHIFFLFLSKSQVFWGCGWVAKKMSVVPRQLLHMFVE